MNRIYKHIWSHVLGRLVVVPECARGAGGRRTGRRRRRQAALLASALLAAPALAQDALPTGGQVVSGAATIETNGGAMTINQSSERLIADWQGFSIGAGNSVTFHQPGAASVALNRVTGQDVSQILGRLNANGQVFLVNPNGVVIGREGRVQTGAFVASTLGISNESFLSGTYGFAGAGGAIVNEGDIAGGRVALIAPTVVNAGTITGNTALAAGTDVLLDFDGDGLLSVEVKGSTMETLVENRGVIKADGGVAILTAKGAAAAMKGVVNNTGTVEANAIGTRNGRILLLGDMQHGEAKVSGKLKAKEVETSAAKVKLDRAVKVETAGGHWLIDPTDIMIDADYAAVLQANLANGNITIATASAGGFDPGNITVSAPLTWGGNTLALIADNNIAINAALNSAAGGLTLLAGGTITADAAVTVGTFHLAAGSWMQNSSVLPAFRAADFTVNGGSFLRVLGGDGSSAAPYSVADVYGLQGIATRTDYLGASWTLADDIDAAVTPAWRGGAGFVPIGTPLWAFTGHFDGRGHVVVGLAASHTDVAGLFGYTYGATIENVGTRDGRMFGALRAGGLVGQTAGGTVLRNVHSGRTVVEGSLSGGVVGEATDGTTISNVYSTNALSFGGYRGGIVGRLLRSTMTGAVARGSVSSTDAVGTGALVAIGAFSTMSSSYWDLQMGGFPVSSWVGPAFQATPLDTLEQSLSQASYADLDFVNTWFMVDGFIRPVLRSEWQPKINYAHQLQLMAMDLDASYTLERDIDMQASVAWQEQFAPIGTYIEGAADPYASAFTGTFDGKGHSIQYLAVTTAGAAGLFGATSGATIRNLTLGSLVRGTNDVGGLVGNAAGTRIENVSAATAVYGVTGAGGLVGSASNSSLENVSVTAFVNADARAGGLVGAVHGSTITNASVAGVTGITSASVAALDTSGGLAGYVDGGSTISNSHATGSVSGRQYVGGLVGQNYGTISKAYATGQVDALDDHAGGLVGYNAGTITDAYATGIIGFRYASGYSGAYSGGLVGSNSGIIQRSYATGAVKGDGPIGGLAGDNSGGVHESFWNTTTSAQATGCGAGSGLCAAEGLTTAEMADPFRFLDAGWNFADTWGTPKSGGAPLLRGMTAAALYDNYVRLSGDILRSYGDAVSTGGIGLDGVGIANVSLGWGDAVTATTDVGTYFWRDGDVLSLAYARGTAADYYVDYGTGGLTITPRVVDLTASRTYDGSAAIASGTIAIGNLVTGETLGLTGAGALAGKNAGQDLALSLGSLTLADGLGKASNYTLAGGTHKADIARATIATIGGITAQNRTYDGTTDAVLSTAAADFAGKVAGDELTVAAATGAFADKKAGSGKSVAISGLALGGADAANYILADDTATTTADIARAAIAAITGITGIDRVYDGTTAAALDLSAATFAGKVAGDVLTVASATGAFADKKAGTGRAVAISGLTLAGADAGNYVLADTTAATSADIARATISAITGITAVGRTYDGTAVAGLDTASAGFADMIAGDALTVASATGAFADKKAGANKAVAISGLSLGGADADNYLLASTTAATSANIGKATISAITDIAGIDRIYDGTTVAGLDTASAGFAGMITGDALRVASATGAFADKKAGANKAVAISGLSLGGADAENYILADTTAAATADIARATISAITGIAGIDRTYDGTAVAGLDTASAGFAGMIAGDALTVASATGAFADKKAGTGKAVAISGLSLGGADADNYLLASTTAATSADVAKATISAITGITAAGRTYDGTTVAGLDTASAGFAGMIAGDVLTVASATGAFTDKTAGAGKTVAISGLSLGGADAGNYVLLDGTATTTADIAKAVLSAVTGITAASKVYDGTASAALGTAGAGFAGMIAGDDLAVASAAGAFADKHAADGKRVNITGLVLGGADAGNYTLADTTATTTADIAKATLTLTGFTAAGKTYDGTATAAIATAGALSGAVAMDDIGFSFAGSTFSDRNAGANKVVTLDGIQLHGTDAGNYTIAGTATTTADIAKATILTVTGITASGKTYDGTRDAALLTGAAGFTGMVHGDALTVATAAGAFLDRNAGASKTVAISGLTLGGLDAGNYTLAGTTATTTADIARATIASVTGITAQSRTYDGTAAATLSTASAGFAGMIAGDDLTVASASGAFADRNAGTGKTVAITGLALGGIDAGNYTLADTTATTTADIARAVLTLSGFAAAGKVYDGTTAAAITSAGTLSGVLLADDVGFSHAGAAFSDRNAGLGKTVRLSGIALSGADAGNYTLTGTATTTADIARATISAVTGITAADRTYDGTRAAALSTGAAGFAGKIAGDDLTVAAATGAFADRNAGTGKAVDISGLVLGGSDAGNYMLADTTASTRADIARATILAVTGITAAGKVYDGTTAAALSTGSAGFTGLLAGDSLTVAAAAGAFADRHAADGKRVNVTGLVLGGADAGNYTLADTTAMTTADIVRATLTLAGFAAADKTYDGTAAAAITEAGTLTGVFFTDDVHLAHGGATFADRNAGVDKTVTLGDMTLTGADAGNYTIAGTATTTADIGRAGIAAVTGIRAADKRYDGTATARLDLTGAAFAGLVAGDSLTVASGTGRFDNAAPGRGKTVRITGLALGGVDAANYVLLDTTALAVADITAAYASPLFPQNPGEGGGLFSGPFFLPSSRALFAVPILIDVSGWRPGAGDTTLEDIPQ